MSDLTPDGVRERLDRVMFDAFFEDVNTAAFAARLHAAIEAGLAARSAAYSAGLNVREYDALKDTAFYVALLAHLEAQG